MKKLTMRSAGLIAGSLAVVGLAVTAVIFQRPEQTPVPNQHPLETRGTLFDARGVALTGLETRWQIALNLKAMRQLGKAESAHFVRELAPLLGMDAAVLEGRVDRPNAAERPLPPMLTTVEMEAINKWLAGSPWGHDHRLVRFVRVPTRTYPAGEAMAPVVGFVDTDGKGLEGLERAMNASLRAGTNVHLSIDFEHQAAVSSLLYEALKRYDAEEAVATVIELQTNRVLALVSLPSYDPNSRQDRYGSALRLKPVTDVFQAGPLVQPFLLSGALSARVPNAEVLRETFVSGKNNAGGRMAQALGLSTATTTLENAGLLGTTGVETGEAHALFRRQGPDDELLRDIGDGSGLAPTLLGYANSFAALIQGLPPSDISLLNRSDRPRSSSMTTSDASRDSARAVLADELRALMVQRVRAISGDPSADFGGLWSTYQEKTDDSRGARNVQAALFSPADRPTHLVVLKIRLGKRVPAKDAGLTVATDILRSVSTARAASPVIATR